MICFEQAHLVRGTSPRVFFLASWFADPGGLPYRQDLTLGRGIVIHREETKKKGIRHKK
jgi:hypothetical protein